MDNALLLGIDIGSTTTKAVVLDAQGAFLAGRYERSHGRPRQTLLLAVEALARQLGLTIAELEGRVVAAGCTGSGGHPVREVVGGLHVNELVAQTRAVGEYYPQARTVIELGGQDSKFLAVRWDANLNKMVLEDMAMNSLCAAGTGAFLDQQAERLGIAIEDEFAALALQSENPARIAGRCTVFAKSDMIHLQQNGTPLPDILAGLALALARNFKSVIGRGKPFTPPVVFQGGVAYNQAVARAFCEVLKLQPGELLIPEHRQFMAAIGCALIAADETRAGRAPAFIGLDGLRDWLQRSEYVRSVLEPLSAAAPRGFPPQGASAVVLTARRFSLNGNGADGAPQPPAYVGIDVGSITTKVVVIDEAGRVLARRYQLTKGRPLDAVRQGLAEVGAEVADHVRVVGVGTTGSGRYLTADFAGGDVVRSEITAQSRAAIAVDPNVDTIFEIGGQDSKFIRLEHGTITHFAMNNACAAGTGSFLEEQATRLELRIEEEFSRRAFCSTCPVGLGERCTVFMESDLVHHQQQGAGAEDLAAGLAYAIVENYLNRVVGQRPIGQHIFFQGGVACNQSVVAAFQARTGRPVTVPPHHEVAGAIGAALLARDELLHRNGSAPATRFRGFDLSARAYTTKSFICQACPNLCEINRVTIAEEPTLFYGARCDMYDTTQRDRRGVADLSDLFAERDALLMGDYAPGPRRAGRPRVGLPRVLHFYDLFPYWRAFFDTLGMDVVLSQPTNAAIARRTRELATAEVCYPVKLVYGHLDDLLGQDIDYLFFPAIMNREENREEPAAGQAESNYCPYIRSAGHLAAATMDLTTRPTGDRVKPVLAALNLQYPDLMRQDLAVLARDLGVRPRHAEQAHAAGMNALAAFRAALRRQGQAALAGVSPDDPAVVLVGRPYNTADAGVSLDLPYKLRKLGVLPIPIDYLPLERAHVGDRYPDMPWRCGQDILAAAALIRQDPRLVAIYVSNFSCGPDSFVISYFRRIMAGKPHLELEIDEHTADTGLVTRCEAFVESLQARRWLESRKEAV